jgi:hypothetical protein
LAKISYLFGSTCCRDLIKLTALLFSSIFFMFSVIASQGGAMVSCLILSYLPSSKGLSNRQQVEALANHFESLEITLFATKILYSSF